MGSQDLNVWPSDPVDLGGPGGDREALVFDINVGMFDHRKEQHRNPCGVVGKQVENKKQVRSRSRSRQLATPKLLLNGTRRPDPCDHPPLLLLSFYSFASFDLFDSLKSSFPSLSSPTDTHLPVTPCVPPSPLPFSGLPPSLPTTHTTSSVLAWPLTSNVRNIPLLISHPAVYPTSFTDSDHRPTLRMELGRRQGRVRYHRPAWLHLRPGLPRRRAHHR
jgi:hypothetical protein